MNKEDQRHGWIMKMKVKWHRLQVKWEQRVNAQIEEELLRLNEYVCEPEYGPLLSESNEETKKESTEGLNHMKDSEQQGDMMTEASSETTRSYVFKTDNLCMIVGIAVEKQLCEDVFRMDEDLEVKGDRKFLKRGRI